MQKSSFAWLAVLCGLVSTSLGQGLREQSTVDAATAVLVESMQTPLTRIPQGLLQQAQAVAVVPNVVKAGLVIGGRHGRGVLMTRQADGTWSLPIFMTLSGGSVGWQAGVQSTDVILVFRTRKSVDQLLKGTFTLGADAAVAAGPLGRQAQAATDAELKSEILSYSRSRGLFAGVSLEGSVLKVDNAAGTVFYQGAAQQGGVPPSAVRLVQTLNGIAAAAQAGQVVQPAAPVAGQPLPAVQPPAQAPVQDPETLRQAPRQASLEMQPLLDETWQKYLALPPEVYDTQAMPTAESLQGVLSHFDGVSADARFAALASRPQFQNTHQLLRAYITALATANPGPLELPPPPAGSR